MPSQEDYLDNLLKDLDSMRINETASDSDILNEGNAILEQMDLPFDDGIFADMAEENIPDIGDAEDIFTEGSMSEDVYMEEQTLEDIFTEGSMTEDVYMEEQTSEDIFTGDSLPENVLMEDLTEGNLYEDTLPEESIQLESIPDELFSMAQEPIDIEELEADENADSMGVGDFMDLSEEEIEKFLVQEQDAEQTDSDSTQSADVENIDLMDMLEQSEDGDLQEIHELLQKSDNNEAISENMDLMSEETPQDYMDLLGEISGEAGVEEAGYGISDKEKKAQERRAKKEERKAARDAKKQERLKAKQEAKAEKEAQKASQTELELQEEDSNENMGDIREEIQPVAEDDLADIEALLNLTGGDDSSTSDDSFGMSLENVLPFAATSEKNFVEDVLKTEESVVLVKKGHKDSSKKGWFARFIEFITEEDEEEDSINRGNEDVQISDENKNIIDEMDKKKKKKKKGKKGKGTTDGETEGAEGESTDEESGKEKKEKKKKKVKKEKIPVELLEAPVEEKKDSKITPKKVIPIALACLSVGVVIVLLASLSGDYSVKRAGRKAYYEGDYETCYQNLYGKELNESEQVMYGKSESILRMRLWFREYELLVQEGAEPEALDSLLESVKNYPQLYTYASEWNAGTEVAEIYTKMINLLSAKYHLTEEQAMEIAATQNDMEYSKKVYAIVDGGTYGSWDELPEVEVEENLRDVLPEEEELDDVLFMENSVNAK